MEITYNIAIQFPEHYYIGICQVNEDCLEDTLSKKGKRPPSSNDLITSFHVADGNDEIVKPIMLLLAKFYDFGAKYFANGKLSGDDVAAKLNSELGEIHLGNPAKSTYSYHYTGVWPHSVNFGELCYSSDPSFDLEITWRYKKCELCHQLTPPLL